MFSLFIGSNDAPDGSSEEQPLRLDGIQKADFTQLLRFMNQKSVMYANSRRK
jgi:hypothetical protein